MNRYNFIRNILVKAKEFIYEEIPCPLCYGSGWTQEPQTARVGPPDSEICDLCDGTGRVERKIKNNKVF